MATIQVCDHCNKNMKTEDILQVNSSVRYKNNFLERKLNYLDRSKEVCSSKCASAVMAQNAETMKRLVK